MNRNPLACAGNLVDVLPVGHPCEVVNVFRTELPRLASGAGGGEVQNRVAVGELVSAADFVRVHNPAGSSHHVGCRERNLHIERAEHAVELAIHIVVRMPSVFVVLGQFRIPLGHGVFHPFRTPPAAAPPHARYYRAPFHPEHRGIPRQEGAGQRNAKHRLVHLPFHFRSVLIEREYAYIPLLVRRQRTDPLPAVTVPPLVQPVHPAPRLERVVEQVIVYFPYRVRRTVKIGQLLPAGVGMVLRVQVDRHAVVHALSARMRLHDADCGKKEREEKKRRNAVKKGHPEPPVGDRWR